MQRERKALKHKVTMSYWTRHLKKCVIKFSEGKKNDRETNKQKTEERVVEIFPNSVKTIF